MFLVLLLSMKNRWEMCWWKLKHFENRVLFLIIEHQYNGYICENVSVESLRRAMMYYIENPQRCIIEGDDAKESIRRMGIDRNSYVHKWLGVMDSIFK